MYGVGNRRMRLLPVSMTYRLPFLSTAMPAGLRNPVLTPVPGPSATLTPSEVDRLLAVIRDLKRHGLGVVYVSHRLEEVFAIADRVMVLRDGRHVGTRPVGEIGRDHLIEMMVGRRLDEEFPPRQVALGPPRLEPGQLGAEL